MEYQLASKIVRAYRRGNVSQLELARRFNLAKSTVNYVISSRAFGGNGPRYRRKEAFLHIVPSTEPRPPITALAAKVLANDRERLMEKLPQLFRNGHNNDLRWGSR